MRLVSVPLGSRSELTLPCHLQGCSLGVSDTLLLVLGSYVLIPCETSFEDKCGCGCLFISTKILHLLSWKSPSFGPYLVLFVTGKCKVQSSLPASIPCSALMLRSIFLNSGYASPRISGIGLSCWVLCGRLYGAWIFAFVQSKRVGRASNGAPGQETDGGCMAHYESSVFN